VKATLVLTGGIHRSRRLFAPEGRDTRPTRALVREALFNMLHGACEGVQVLDLFAGSGALGFEAISRGAERATFCDRRAEAIGVIRKNAALLREEDRCLFLLMDWHQALRQLSARGQRFDLVFLDPPYGLDLFPVLETLHSLSLLNPDAILALEHRGKADVTLPPNFAITRAKRYGESGITLISPHREEKT
jgi:16S rRNA (guanine966-N2)-methyltransferase